MNNYQDLSKFKLPTNFRGRPAWFVQLWWIVDASLFRHSPQFAYKFRSNLLRIFGAKIGKNVIIRPTAKFTYPWKVEIGNNSWIGDEVTLYSLGEISIGTDTVISQKSYICAADHDHNDIKFPIRSRPVKIGDGCWIATDCYIGPQTEIANGTVIGARSSVFKSIKNSGIYVGSPAHKIADRKLSN